MLYLPIDCIQAMTVCATDPQPKVKDLKTGEVALDKETGQRLYTVGVAFIACGGAEVIKVTVPENGIDTAVTSGLPVRFTGLVAFPWENNRNGENAHGVAFRAAALTVQG